MHIRRRLFSLFCCLLLGVCMIVPVHAAAVSNLTPAETYCIEHGYLALDENGCFNGRGELSADAFIDAIMTAFFPDTGLMGLDAANWLHDENVITGPELSRLRDDRAVNWIMAWRITLMLSENWPVPAECFPEIEPQANCVGSYADARATAIYMRLATGREFAIARFSRSDFASYFYKLLTGNYTPVTSIFEAMPGSDLIDFDRSVLTYGTYRAWNGYFKGFGNLPEQYLDQFRDDGWSVIFSPVYFGPGGQAIKGGLCSYSRKEIYLNRCDEKGLYHEFGHYIAMASGAIPELKPIFDAEASQMREILGDYSQTSPGEYFAECVSFWLHRPDGRDILRDNSPRMYMLIADLISDADTHAAQAA